MITLGAPTVETRLSNSLSQRVWLLGSRATPSGRRSTTAFRINAAESVPEGFGLYVYGPGDGVLASRTSAIRVGPEMGYLAEGDIVRVSPDGRQVRALWRHSSRQNSLLLTERCDHYCLMCSQPPKLRLDDHLLEDAFRVVRLLPPDALDLCFTGGEPTIYGARFVALLEECRARVPQAAIHILSNGRRFADPAFSDAYAAVGNPEMMVGVPLYGAEGSLHNYIVQADGAFEETVRGICRLGERHQRIEIRVVVHRGTAPALVETAEFIARNLPFVEQVALMGLEMTGLARANADAVWMDPFDYREQLTEATLLLHEAGLRTLVYNHQLCVIERAVWPFAVRSISDWKTKYDEECDHCAARDRCGGFFATSSIRSSEHIHRIDAAVI